jgi:hypothetical protein
MKTYTLEKERFHLDVAPGRPLLVLGCSQTKVPTDKFEFVRFLKLYDGPMWKQVKAAGYPIESVSAISALYGYLEPGMKIETYDVKMDEERRDRMCSTSNHVYCFARDVRIAGSAFVVGGGMYQELARTAIRHYPELEPMVTFASGSFLAQRKQLGEWLRQQAPREEVGADDKPQLVIPGADANLGDALQRKADAPLKPRAAQKPADVGLFGDGHLQTDLFGGKR